MKYQSNKKKNPMAPRETIPVVMIRHAQSQWNWENRFTGWADPPLTEKGIAEARVALPLGWEYLGNNDTDSAMSA